MNSKLTIGRRQMLQSIAAFGAGAALVASGQVSRVATAASDPGVTQVTFQQAMRKLWEDHIAWTRFYIVSAVADLPDLELTTRRLLRNQTDIGDAIKPFYGEDAGDALAKLLEEHITGAAELLTAAKGGDEADVEAAGALWYANADAIAVFLNAANPAFWPLANLQTEMTMHLDHTLEEATARLAGDFTADIAAYDKVHDHILHMADLLSTGIVQQFPERFV